jgi:hypothetical protein
LLILHAETEGTSEMAETEGTSEMEAKRRKLNKKGNRTRIFCEILKNLVLGTGYRQELAFSSESEIV